MLTSEFVPKDCLSEDQLSDPDYAFKRIDLMNKNNFEITVCSKCHHCR
jgi:hypothetical protein